MKKTLNLILNLSPLLFLLIVYLLGFLIYRDWDPSCWGETIKVLLLASGIALVVYVLCLTVFLIIIKIKKRDTMSIDKILKVYDRVYFVKKHQTPLLNNLYTQIRLIEEKNESKATEIRMFKGARVIRLINKCKDIS